MNTFNMAFAAPAALQPRHNLHVSLSPTTTLPMPNIIPLRRRAAVRRSLPPCHHSRHTPHAAANIDNVPMEPIPALPAELPAHWDNPGVYGIYSDDGQLQYVAATLNVRFAIDTHRLVIADVQKLAAVRMLTVSDPGDAPLDMLAENWVRQHVEAKLPPPPGNTDLAPQWRDSRPTRTTDVYFSGTDVQTEVREILRNHTVVLFMKGTRAMPRCGFSKSVVETLDSVVGPNFVCVDCLDETRNPGLREGIKQFTAWPTIPQLFVDGEFVGGADIVQGMHSNGELATLLQPAVEAAAAEAA